MQLLRNRRRGGIACCVTVEVFRLEIEEMVRRGLLQSTQERDRGAITHAVGKIMENWYYRS